MFIVCQAPPLFFVCSAAAAASLPTSAELLGSLRRSVVLLQEPARHQQYQEAHSQVVAGLVHALHGVPPGDLQLRGQAEAAMQAAVFQPMAASLQEVHRVMAAPAPAQLAAARAATWHLHAALRQLQALLNGLESYAWNDGMASCSNNGTLPAAEKGHCAPDEFVARGVAAAAVAALLTCWPQLAEVCGWLGRLPNSAAPVRRELYQELSQCLCSAMALNPEAALQVLLSLADTVTDTFFLPGAACRPGAHKCWGALCCLNWLLMRHAR